MSTDINIKKKISIEEEGALLTADVNNINFVGPGVTASTLGNDVTVTVAGSIGGTVYYMNETVTQAPYKEFSSNPTSAVEQIIPATVAGGATATIAAYQTPVGVPNTTVIPAGLWQLFLHFNAGSAGQNWIIRPYVYKRDLGGIETLIFTPDPEIVTGMSTTTTMYTCDGVFPNTTLLTTDRIVVKIDVQNTSGVSQTVNFRTEGSQHYSVAATTLNQAISAGSITSVSGTAPIVSSGGSAPAISIPQATALVDGYLSLSDWAVFNAKVASTRSISTSAPLSGGGDLSADRTLSITQATSSVDGYLSSTDWSTFSGKQNAITLTTTGTSGAATLIGSTLNIPQYAAGGLTYFTEAQNSSAPNATVNVDSLTAIASTTDADISIVPKGTGAFQLAVPDNTTAGGNKRGLNSVDLQTASRSSANQVASGNYVSLLGGYRNRATGNYSVIAGNQNLASGQSSVALGELLTASAIGSVGLGVSCTSSGSYSFSSGLQSTATNSYAVAMGYLCTASGQSSVSLGASNNVSGTSGFGAGGNNTNSGNYSAVFGFSNSISGMYTIRAGYGNTGNSAYSVTTGYNNVVSGSENGCFGSSSTVNANYAFSLGYQNTASGIASIALGQGNTASGLYSTSIGTGNNNSGTYGALATGWSNTMSSTGGFVGGYSCIHSGSYGLTMGYGSSNSGAQTIVIGQNNGSSAAYSLVVGNNHSVGGTNNSVTGSGGVTISGGGRQVQAYFNTVAGDAQNTKIVLTRRTIDATLTPLTVGGTAPYFGQNEFTLQDNSCVRFKGTIVGKQTGSTNIGVWDIDGVISKVGTVTINVNNVNLVTNPSAWGTPTLTVNGSLGLSVNVIGKAATNIQWTAYLECTEVVY